MDNQGIFNNKIFDLPIVRSEPDIIVFTKNFHKQFLETINSFESELGIEIAKNVEIITTECKLIEDALCLSFMGKSTEAFKKIVECLDILNKHNLLEVTNCNSELFRIRTSSSKNLTKGELFHVPFNLRVKVATQRYSVPGLPCLYLADSIFVAWEELNRPDFEKVHVSKFDIKDSKFKVLNLNTTAQDMRERCFKQKKINHIKQLVKFISYFPLLAICSHRVLKREDVFKPEYVIPQMILQYVIVNSKIDAIQFKSNRVTPSIHNVGSFNNIVIPVQTINNSGYCEVLKSKVKLTPPLSWSLLEISDPMRNFLNKTNQDINISDISRAYHIELIEGEKTNYQDSKFGILEQKLRVMPVETMK